jgi:hypothetical protein
MGKGLLAWWRQRIVARGLAGVALLSIPVAVAALIGFGTSLSGVAGGLSAVTSGPDAVPASSPTAPVKLSRAVAALGNRQTPAAPATGSVERSTGDASSPTITGTGGGGGTTGTSDGGSGGGSGGTSGTTELSPTITAPSTPDVSLPGTDTSTGDTVGSVNDTLNNVVDGVDNTLNGLLGQ